MTNGHTAGNGVRINNHIRGDTFTGERHILKGNSQRSVTELPPKRNENGKNKATDRILSKEFIDLWMAIPANKFGTRIVLVHIAV